MLGYIFSRREWSRRYGSANKKNGSRSRRVDDGRDTPVSDVRINRVSIKTPLKVFITFYVMIDATNMRITNTSFIINSIVDI